MVINQQNICFHLIMFYFDQYSWLLVHNFKFSNVRLREAFSFKNVKTLFSVHSRIWNRRLVLILNSVCSVHSSTNWRILNEINVVSRLVSNLRTTLSKEALIDPVCISPLGHGCHVFYFLLLRNALFLIQIFLESPHLQFQTRDTGIY